MKSIGVFRVLFFLGLWLGIAGWSVPAQAQTSASGPTLTALSNFEQSLTTGDILPVPTNIPPSLLAGLAGGAIDLRLQANYNPPASLLTLTVFEVPTGSPTPTNLAQLNPANILGGVTISVDRIYVTSTAVMFVGSISSSGFVLAGNLQSEPASFSFAYSSDTPPKITNVIGLVGGALVLYSPTATGTVTITKPSSGSGGGATGVTIVVNGGTGVFPNGTNTFQTASNLITFDASKSTSSNAGALTYSWAVMPAGTAGIYFASTANPVIQLFAKGTYVITVTVTDATGATATQTITIQYV